MCLKRSQSPKGLLRRETLTRHDTIDAIANELQHCWKHARDMDFQMESMAFEMTDVVELSKRLTGKLDEVKRQCDLRDVKVDQLVLELDEEESHMGKVRSSFK